MYQKQPSLMYSSQPPSHTAPQFAPISPPSSYMTAFNQSSSSLLTIPLKLKQFTINFYSNFKLTLNIPEQTTVYQLTQIIRNYHVLHTIHGKKSQQNQSHQGQDKANLQVKSKQGYNLDNYKYQPWALSTVNGRLQDDLYLIQGTHCLERQIGFISTQDLKIQYKTVQLNKNDKKNNIFPIKKYQFIGQIQSKHQIASLDLSQNVNKTYIARNTKTCTLHTIHLIPKNTLTFHQIQKIYSTISYYQKWSTTTPHFQSNSSSQSPYQYPYQYPQSLSSGSHHHQQYFPYIYQTFQTKQKLCIVTEYLPFNLNYIKINNNLLMDCILGQLSKILHIMDRDHININDQLGNQIQLDNFAMDFKFNVKFMGIMLNIERNNHKNYKSKNTSPAKKQQIKIQQQQQVEQQKQRKQQKQQQKSYCCSKNSNFSSSMQKLFQKLLQNCSMKIIQLYLPLLHWFKNKRITSYIDFLKYTQLSLFKQQSVNMENQFKYRNILKNLMQNYNGMKISRICESQLKQLLENYHASTNLFTYPRLYSHSSPKQLKLNPEQQNHTSRAKIDQLVENKSTVKKKKKLSISCIEVQKPLFQARYLLKRNRTKNKGRDLFDRKAQKKIKAKSMIESKVKKTKKHTRKISQFLIDD